MATRSRDENGLRWRKWNAAQAREALAELASSGETAVRFAERKGVSTQRLGYWKKQLASATPTFVAVPLPTHSDRQIEIVIDGVSVRVREDLDVEDVARLVAALVRMRRC